jgi:AbrB family looped-hinge helix DNA binding protein
MPKVTSKLQLTVPKQIADQYGIRPGDELEWIPEGESIRVQVARRKSRTAAELTPEERLVSFDENTRWLNEVQADQLREARMKGTHLTRGNRGWTRDDLYNLQDGLSRGLPRRH